MSKTTDNIAFEARVNTIYYQGELRWLQRWDMGLRLAAAILASGGVALAAKYWTDKGPLVVGTGSALAGTFSLVFAFPTRITALSSILPAYVDLMHAAELSTDTPEDVERLGKELARIGKLEAEKIGAPNDARMRRAHLTACEQLGKEPPADLKRKPGWLCRLFCC